MSNLNSKEYGSIQHWSEFGQRGEGSSRRVTAEDWKTHAFCKPVVSKWNLAMPSSELPKLLNGMRPGAMEDKWFIYADGPDAGGTAVLHMYRSWTGYKMAEVQVVLGLDGDGKVTKDALFAEIKWESDPERRHGQTEEGAKEMAKEVCKWCLNIQFDAGGGSGKDNS